ncbi:hypothetical protein [Spiroplasma endosymbiont of Acasis viretata]|uniref:hypothetical protein n=1 Tax=Spiroplasma endosymbiont of Acasis viretata TaxID=3066306 RepID=UPI00313A9B1B
MFLPLFQFYWKDFKQVLTVGLVCLAGGIDYYSWNFYKNKKQELNIKVIEKNENEKKYLDEYKEKTTLDSNNLVNNEASNISKYECNMKLDNATKINQIILDNNNSKNVEEEYDMLDDAKEAINDEDEWAIIDLPSYGSNHI